MTRPGTGRSPLADMPDLPVLAYGGGRGSHLYRAYPKLGITSRAQLRGALGRKNPGDV